MIVLDDMEYPTDAAAQAAWVTQYVNFLSGGSISAESQFSSSYIPAYGGDGNLSTRWASAFGHIVGSWWQYDLGAGVAKTAIRAAIYPSINAYKDFYIKGSNNGTNWDTLYTGTTANSESWQYFTFSNTTAYRYYRFETIAVYSGTSTGFYEAQLFEELLSVSSESTIKQEGSYSLKIVAPQTTSLNKTVTRTLDPTFNLSGQEDFKFNVRSNRTGSNFKIGLHDSGGTTTEVTPNITSADTWQEVTLDLSAVSDANKDAIDSIIYTQLNDDAETTVYMDYMRTLSEDEGTGGGISRARIVNGA